MHNYLCIDFVQKVGQYIMNAYKYCILIFTYQVNTDQLLNIISRSNTSIIAKYIQMSIFFHH